MLMNLRREVEGWKRRGGRVEECHEVCQDWLIPNRKQASRTDFDDFKRNEKTTTEDCQIGFFKTSFFYTSKLLTTQHNNTLSHFACPPLLSVLHHASLHLLSLALSCRTSYIANWRNKEDISAGGETVDAKFVRLGKQAICERNRELCG